LHLKGEITLIPSLNMLNYANDNNKTLINTTDTLNNNRITN